MSDLWGFVSGQQQATQDSQQTQLFNLSMQEGQQRLADNALTMEARKQALDNSKLMQGRQEKAIKLMALAAKPNTGDPTEDTVNTLFQMGQADMEVGLPEQAAETLKTAAQLQENHSKIVGQQTQEQIKKFTLFSDLAQGVTDQKSWDTAKMIYQSQFPGQLDPKIANRPYSPELIEQLKAGAQTQLQKAQTDAAKAEAVLRKSEVAKTSAETDLAKSRTQVEKERAINLKKAGATQVLPKPAEIEAAVDLIKADKGKDVPTQVARAAAMPIAERAKALMQDNGLPASQAFKQAFSEAKARGDLDGVKSATQVKNSDLLTQANSLIDDIVEKASTDTTTFGITGVGGYATRLKETATNILGSSDDTTAHDFEGSVKDLQLMIPKLQNIGLAKYKVAEITKIVRGLSPGDTKQNVVSAAQKVKALLNGGEIAPKPAKSDFTVGQTYTDANGNSAVYQADGTWKPL